VASLKDIRRRISSVKNTQQITRAMKMVAASKLRKAQMAISGAKPYALKLEILASRLLKEINESKSTFTHPLLTKGKEEAKIALLVISSDKGLCGSYNSNVTKAALKRYQELQEKGDNTELFFFGKKSYEIFKRTKLHGNIWEDFWTSSLTSQSVSKVAEKFVQGFIEGKYSRVEVVHTEFKSAISFKATSKQILPIESIKEEESQSLAYVYEPNREELLKSLLPMMLHTQFYKCFAASLASEMGARMMAMENATKSADDMIASLSLLANRTRQAAITKELLEIIGGAEALK